MKKLLLTFFIFCIFLGLGATKIHAEEIHTKNIFSLEPQNWIFNSGMDKGKNQDRQDLGFILSPDTVLKVRQVNPEFKNNVTLRLIGDAEAIERSVDVGAGWTTISSTEATVPFVTTPYNAANPKLEYEVESNQPQKPLPIYNHGDSEKQFLNTWDKYDCEYGLIQGKDFQLFVPKAGKELARYTTNFPSLDGLIDYYEKVFALDNKMAGLDNSSPTNQLGKNRYFLKARKDGSAGIAGYYNTNWTVQVSPTGIGWFGRNSWLALHEIAHGYQTSLDGRGMNTLEVSNNIFGATFQYQEMGKKEADRVGWLFDGNKAKIDADLYNRLIKNPGTYDSVGLRDKLILQMMLLQKAGTEAFTKMYQGYRLEANQPGYSAGSYFMPNELNRYYSEYSGYDFTPVLERWGYKLPVKQVSINRARGYRAVASLADVVPESHLLAARALIDPTALINSSFEMVANQEIAPLGLKGELTVQLNPEDATNLKGAKILLKDGKKIVQEQVVRGKDVAFTHVPNGIYTVEFLGDAMSSYEVPQYYAYVKEAQNQLTIPALPQIKATNLINQQIMMKGLGDKQVGYVQTDVAKRQVTVAITTTSPHSYFGTSVYVGVKIFNAKGDLVYEKEATGNNATTETKVLSFETGDKIEIYHAEPSRLTSTEPIVFNDKNNVFTMTKWGLRNEQLKNNPEQDLIRKIDAEGQRITQDEGLKATPFIQSPEKKHLALAIDLLNEPFKGEYLEKYSSILSSMHYGDTFDFTFKRTDASPFATMQVDLLKKQAIVDTKAGKPNPNYPEKYAAILIQSEVGIKKYERNYHGTTTYAASQKTVDLAVGDYITVYHEAGDKQLGIVNQDSQASLPTTKEVTYQVTSQGLERVPKAAIPPVKQATPKITGTTYIGGKTLSGTATPDSSVEILIQNRVIATVTANEAGQWEATVPALLVDQVIYAKTTFNGQVAESLRQNVTPEKPSITSMISAGETQLTGTASPSVKVGIVINGNTVATVTASATGQWTSTVSALVTGQKVQARVVAGTQQADSDIYTIVPKKPTIAATLTTKEETTITGQAVPGSKVEVWSQNKKIATTVADQAGQSTVTIPALTAGQIIRFQATFGTQTQESDDFVVAPEKPEITSPVVGKATTITGTTSRGASVAILIQGQVITTVSANDNGEWKATVPSLIGGQTVQAKAMMGATHQTSDSYTVAPDKPTIQAPLTAKDTTITGITSPGAAVKVFIETHVVATATANETGRWTAKVPALQAAEDVQVEATIANQSQKSDVYTVIQEKPVVTSKLVEGETLLTGLANPNAKVDIWISNQYIETVVTDATGRWRSPVPKLMANQSIQVRGFLAGAYVDSIKSFVGLDKLARVKAKLNQAASHVTVSGEGASKATITIKAGTLTIGTGVTDDQGHFEITVPAQAEGTVLSLTQTKNTQTSPVTESVVYAKLAKPSDISTVSEHSASITGKGAAEATVHVVANGHEIGHAKVNATGHFTVPIPKQAEGTVLSITQAKGDNESDAVEVTVVSGRLEAPTLTPYYTGIAYIRGKAAVGSTKVTLNIDGKNIRTVNVNADGTFSIYANDIPALKQAGTKFEIVAQNAHNQTSEAAESTVQAVQAPALKPYQAGQEFVTGTVATDVTKIGLYDKAGTLLRYGQINTDGTYQILAKDKAALQQVGDVFSVKAFNAIGAVSEETKGIVTAPPVMLAPPTIADYYAASTYIRGKAPTGATSITLAINGKNIRNGAIAADGSYSIYAGDIALLKEKGTTFSVTARDANNQASKEATSTVLGILPPVVAPYQADQTYITGIVEKGATKIGLYDKDNKLIRYGQINPDGTFKIYAKDTNIFQTVGTTFIVKAIDAKGSVSSAALGNVVAHLPGPLSITNYQVGAAYVKGKAPEGTKSIAILIDGKSIRTGSVALDGNYSIYVSGVEDLKLIGTVFHVVAYDMNKEPIRISTSEVKAPVAVK